MKQEARISATILMLAASAAFSAGPAATQKKAVVIQGRDGWEFWEGQIAAYSKEDELPTKNAAVILDFHEQLKGAGILLVVVPAPDQLYVGREHFAGGEKLTRKHFDAAYEFLRSKDVAVVNVMEVLEKLGKAGEKTALSRDVHLTPPAYEALAKSAAEIARKKVALASRPKDFDTEPGMDVEPAIVADENAKPVAMNFNKVRYPKGDLLQTRRGAELMVMGDSHVTAHNGVHASFTEHLACELGAVPDVRWRQGEAEAESLRVDFARQKDNLEGNRVVVWIFREAALVTKGEWKKVAVIRK
jgi:hypothetical protein